MWGCAHLNTRPVDTLRRHCCIFGRPCRPDQASTNFERLKDLEIRENDWDHNDGGCTASELTGFEAFCEVLDSQFLILE